MFELVDLILTSPIGAFILAGLQDVFYAILIVSDCDDCGFEDLGKLLFGGLILAVVVGIAVSFLWRRWQSRDSGFISIQQKSGPSA